jgi:hypothetical protein
MDGEHHGTVWKEGVEYRAKCVCGWNADILADSATHAWDEYIIHLSIQNSPLGARVFTGAF